VTASAPTRTTDAAPGTSATARDDAPFYLPNLCEPRMVLVVVLIAELVAVLLAIARVGVTESLLLDLGRTSLFMLWIGLGSAAALCYLRPHLAKLGVVRGSAAALGLLMLVTAIVSEAAWRGATLGLYDFDDRDGGHAAFLAGNLLICAIVGAVGLRYFYVTHEWRRNVEREARSRVEALQARIRPHFLYNSMNTIAALTRSDPERAETAVEDLADLFRFNLQEQRAEVTLAEELEVARTYERIERLRLGARLAVEWRVEGVPPGTPVPTLLIQPLLENAIYHGIERLPGGGTVLVEIRGSGHRIDLSVSNPRAADGAAPGRTGNRIAVANIRERLALAYPGEASLDAGDDGDRFVVRVRLPLRDPPPGRATTAGGDAR
jgi:two-component system sensor histidine kinase AlgZ